MAYYFYIRTFKSATSTGQIIQFNDDIDINDV